MKKFLLPLLLFVSLGLMAQEEETPDKRDTAKNELSIDALNLVAFGALDITYERIITPHSSWSLEGFILALNRENEDPSEIFSRKASVTGKYKYFFGEKTASGFYVNGMAMISTGEYSKWVEVEDDISYREEEVTQNYSDLALGFGLGVKFVSRQGFFLDLGAGIGRNLLNSESPTIVGQFKINLGMRF